MGFLDFVVICENIGRTGICGGSIGKVGGEPVVISEKIIYDSREPGKKI